MGTVELGAQAGPAASVGKYRDPPTHREEGPGLLLLFLGGARAGTPEPSPRDHLTLTAETLPHPCTPMPSPASWKW